MKKSTKIVAALGIAAGIGIAALPLGTFALDPTASSPQQKDVKVELVISNAVGISFSGLSEDSGTEGKCSASILPSATGTCAHTVTIASNTGNATLGVKSKAGTSDLEGGTGTTPIASAAAAANTSYWNITATGGSETVSGAVMPGASDTALMLHNGATAGSGFSEKTLNITYNFGAAPAQEAGTYSDIITYTVTATNS